MKDTPILMSGPLVVPTLAGLKIHSCRPNKLAIPDDADEVFFWSTDREPAAKPGLYARKNGPGGWLRFLGPCPYGVPGDRLWVRETWAYYGGDEYLYQQHRESVAYRADFRPTLAEGLDSIPGGRWRPSIHMPRWASRITLEVTGVSVFRVQAITEEIAKREGLVSPDEYQDIVDMSEAAQCGTGTIYRDAFRRIWIEIYGPESWAANPWVWGIGFKRVQG